MLIAKKIIVKSNKTKEIRPSMGCAGQSPSRFGVIKYFLSNPRRALIIVWKIVIALCFWVPFVPYASSMIKTYGKKIMQTSITIAMSLNKT